MKKTWPITLFCALLLFCASYVNAGYFEMPSVISDYTSDSEGKNSLEETIFCGKSRKSKSKSGGSYRLWADFFGYSGSLPELSSGGPESDVDGFGFNVGFGFPRKGKSLSFFYTHNAPTQKFDHGIKFETENHLFGVIFDKTIDIFQLYGVANAGFDNYDVVTQSGSTDLDGWQMNFYGEMAAELPFGSWNIRPHLGLGYHYLSIDYDSLSGNQDALESNLGVRCLRNCLGTALIFQGRLSWIHQYLDQSSIYRMRYSSQVGVMSPTQLYFGETPGRDWLCCGVGLKYYILDPLSISIDYDLNVSKNIAMHIGTLSARLVW